MPATHAAAGTTTEPFNFALARRTLTQSLPFQIMGPQAQREAAQSLRGDVVELATSFNVDRGEASRALVKQQMTVSDDIAALFPGDSDMGMAASQFRAKASEHFGEPQIDRPRQAPGE